MSRRSDPPRFALAFLALAPLVEAPAADREHGRVERLRGDVETLAAREWQGRRAGTAGAARAAVWLAEEFQRIGLQPGAGGGSYLQRFPFIHGAELGPGNALRAAGERGEPEEDFRPLAFSAAGSAEGEVVFAGYGISAASLGYDDFEGLAVEGRIVLVLRYAPRWGDRDSPWQRFAGLRRKAAEARRRGAAALLIVTGSETSGVTDDLIPFRIDAALEDAGLPVISLKRRLAERLFYGSGQTLSEAQKRIDREGRPSSGPMAMRAELRADLTPGWSATHNVVGVLRAPGSEQSVVVGAHYDHLGLGGPGSLSHDPGERIHHGADDNASGTAGMLELARSFAARREVLRRDLIFVAFGAEELGLLGSAHFVENPTLPLDRVVAMTNLDMIGRLRAGGLRVHGVGTSPFWRPLLEQLQEELGLRLQLHDGGFGPSDHASFFAAGKPVLFLFTGLHSDYHRPGDTAHKVSASGMSRVVELAERILDRLATELPPIPFAEPAVPEATQPAVR